MIKYKIVPFFFFLNSFSSEGRVAIGYSGLDVPFFRYLGKYVKISKTEETKKYIEGWRSLLRYGLPNEYCALRFFHKICSYTGNPYLSRLLFCLLKFNCDIYLTKNHYITIKLFDFSYGQKILPWWLLIKESQEKKLSNGVSFYYIEQKIHCINGSIGFLEFGYGFIEKYDSGFVKKYTNKLYYSLEITAVFSQGDVVLRWAPLIYRFDNGMAIKIRLLNISIVNNLANLWMVQQYNLYFPKLVKKQKENVKQPVWIEDSTITDDERWWWEGDYRFVKNQDAVIGWEKIKNEEESLILQQNQDSMPEKNEKKPSILQQKLTKIFHNLLFNISITFYFFDDCKDED